MTKDRNELLSNDCELTLLGKVDLRLNEICIAIQVGSNQLGEELEHADRLGIVDFVRCRVDGTERCEKTVVATDNGDRYITLQAIDRRRVVVAVLRAFVDVINDDEFVTLPDFVADGRLDLELPTSLEPKINIVE